MTSIAASLEIDGRLECAISLLPDSTHPAAKLLTEAATLLGGTGTLASVLRGLAEAASQMPEPPRAVWSGRTFDGDSDHTTAAIARLIDDAKEDVFASTYSATTNSPFVDALWRAIARGVSVTLLVEGKRMAETAEMLARRLIGAHFLTYLPPAGEYGLQHSKVVIVDSSFALVTSANLSGAAAHRNLEAGILVRDPVFASKMRQRFFDLKREGALIPLNDPLQ